jgi:uncharacterized protein (DUF169 family)
VKEVHAMRNADIANRVTEALALDTPAVALTFTDEPPESAGGPDRAVPSACSFWRLAERGVFYAPAEAHFNCPVGAMVMGFPLTDAVQETLGGLVTMMSGSGYLGADEAGQIPAVQHPARGVLYGPLADLPVPPEIVLLWLTPRQAMLYNEAAGTASWSGGSPLTTGRPGCAALPAALARDSAAMSLGCAGMRTFTEISDDRMLAVIPGNRIAAFADDLDRVAAANDTMLTFYQDRKAAHASSEMPDT